MKILKFPTLLQTGVTQKSCKTKKNIEYRTRNNECRRNVAKFDFKKRLIGFAVSIIRTAKLISHLKLHNSTFLVRYSIFNQRGKRLNGYA